ncbi:hypothetical protein OIO90_000493 [Microbotryomycetes sp. JL221]|nr:hypothetical protein OIO90_000493 [Microbotryomycetes sp. JL221]
MSPSSSSQAVKYPLPVKPSIAADALSASQAHYIHGHHPSVLKSHSARTVENSAGYLLPHLRPGMDVLDCTITIGFPKFVGGDAKVVGIEPPGASTVLEQARHLAQDERLSNVKFEEADVHRLPFDAGSFDVVHVHQVLQHISDQVNAVKEMKRVLKLGGVVAAREAIFDSFMFYPELPGLTKWLDLYKDVARSSGGEPNAGKRLRAWAHAAGFADDDIHVTVSTSSFTTADECRWWGEMWAERVVESEFARTAQEKGLTTRAELEHLAQAWIDWSQHPDAWFAYMQGELVARNGG